ncbi:MAG: ATP-binding protein [Candidatus Eremiobacterota bacterium]
MALMLPHGLPRALVTKGFQVRPSQTSRIRSERRDVGGGGWLIWVVGLAGLPLAGIVLTARPGLPDPGPGGAAGVFSVAALVLTALILELTAVPQPGMGCFSAAPACYLALALSGRNGPQMAVMAALLGLSARLTVVRPPWPALSLLADLFPLLAALAGLTILGPTLGTALGPTFLLLDLYVVASWLVPELLASALSAEDLLPWKKFQHRTRLAWFSVRVAAPALASLSGAVAGMLLLPALMSLQWAARRALISYRAEEREELRRRLDFSLQTVEGIREEQVQTRRDLKGAIEESVLKEELARELARSTSYRARLETALRLARTLVPCRSAVIFELEDERILPVVFESPRRSALEAAALQGAEEPIVRQALTSRRPVELEGDSQGRLMQGESVGVAIPLDAQTALYVGSSSAAGWTPSQVRLLGMLAALVGPGLEPARQVERLADQAARSEQLKSSLDRLGQLLSATLRLSRGLDREALLNAIDGAVADLAPNTSRMILDADLTPLRSVPPGQKVPAEARQVAESGRPLLLEGRVLVPMQAEGGNVGVILVRGQGLTREHQDSLQLLALQAALALSNARLHEETLEAYDRLSQSEAQLVQSSKLAAVGQLAAGVAHELNTPLGTILLALDSMEVASGKELTREAARQARGIELAQEAAKQARSIVDKLLYYSREARVGRQRADLNEVVADTLLLIGNQLRLDKVNPVCELGQLPPVLANTNEIQQVLTNLLLNARDSVVAGPALSRDLYIRTGVLDGRVVLEVRDQGPGVPREVADRIFDPFFTTKPVGKGTGLGLSVSGQIVAAHGGTLELLNPGGPGAAFRVSLPQAPAPGSVEGEAP